MTWSSEVLIPVKATLDGIVDRNQYRNIRVLFTASNVTKLISTVQVRLSLADSVDSGTHSNQQINRSFVISKIASFFITMVRLQKFLVMQLPTVQLLLIHVYNLRSLFLDES